MKQLLANARREADYTRLQIHKDTFHPMWDEKYYGHLVFGYGAITRGTTMRGVYRYTCRPGDDCVRVLPEGPEDLHQIYVEMRPKWFWARVFVLCCRWYQRRTLRQHMLRTIPSCPLWVLNREDQYYRLRGTRLIVTMEEIEDT
ncbi:MAG: hypothetical protein V6Z86_05575 [Hyphomicrobiales bacterium]